MADTLKLTIEIDKDLIVGMLALGGGLKNNIPTSMVKEWLNEHDDVNMPTSVTEKIPEMRAGLATLALLGISKQLSKDKPTKEEEK